jgi:hypothetical protein
MEENIFDAVKINADGADTRRIGSMTMSAATRLIIIFRKNDRGLKNGITTFTPANAP